MAFPRVRVGLCLVLALAGFVQVKRHERTEHRLSVAASAVAGVKVSVQCQSLTKAWLDLGPELGYVPFGPDGVPEHRTLIKWETCRQLSAWLHSDKARPALDQVIAVHVLTHESMHMAGTRDEAVTECRAVQRDAAMARRLGASAQAARGLAVRDWHEVYPRMPDAYRSADCAPGAELDEHLPDAPWS